MRSLNKATIIGNLGADPEIRQTNTGTKVATLSIATSRSWLNTAGIKEERTEWHRVILWDKLADIAEKFLTKGDRVYVEGRIEYRKWVADDGTNRYTTRDPRVRAPHVGGEPRAGRQAQTRRADEAGRRDRLRR